MEAPIGAQRALMTLHEMYSNFLSPSAVHSVIPHTKEQSNLIFCVTYISAFELKPAHPSTDLLCLLWCPGSRWALPGGCQG